MQGTKKHVLAALQRDVLAREDDRVLLFRVYEAQGLILSPEQTAVIPQLSPPGSITRNRARVQNEEQRLRPDSKK